ncbi:MAG TPA: helix-turn-helix transcriptional regulator [Burkholderiales bacterium]|nr:helix-turn-helix transcriptional regulator [Burkholderiales bacterium]
MAKSLRSKEHTSLLAILRASREEAKLTQRQLADRLGWSKSKYASVESGERRLDVIEFRHLAKALKVDPLELFRRWVNW